MPKAAKDKVEKAEKPEKKEKPAKKEKAEKAEKPAKKEKAEKPEKKEKKAKDPNHPKRALGSYMYFAGDKRKELKEAHPEWGVTEIGKETGALWKKLSDKDKKKYDDLAAKDKKRYEEEMKAYKKE